MNRAAKAQDKKHTTNAMYKYYFFIITEGKKEKKKKDKVSQWLRILI